MAVILRIVLVNKGPLKSADTFLLLKPEQGQFFFLFDKEIVSQVVGTRQGSYEWALNRPLPPQSEISFRADCRFHAKLPPHPQFRTWWDMEGRTPLEDVAIEWTIFADSAPPQTGRITMGSLGLIPCLNQQLVR